MVTGILVLAAALLVLHLLLVIGVSEIAVHPPVKRRPCDTDGMAMQVAATTGSSAEVVKIQALDGVTLSAWWLKLPQACDAVLICHGVADTSFGVMGAALMFLRNGYSVLAPDNRGHGGSGGFVTYGLREAEDISRWQTWLTNQGVANCFAFGESLGASSLLQSLSLGAKFKAIVAECPFSSFARVVFDRVLRVNRHFVPPPAANWCSRLWTQEILLYLKVRYGADLKLARPVQAVKETPVPILLIHGTGDYETPVHHSEEIFMANRHSTRLWLVPDAPHTGGAAAGLIEFERRVIAFLQRGIASYDDNLAITDTSN